MTGSGPPGTAVVSVIIPVYDDQQALEGCLETLRGQVDAPRFEVVVCDNGSCPPLPAPDGDGLDLRLVVEPRPGSYAARNTAVAAAAGEVLLFTDADCRPRPDWVRQATAAVARTPDAIVAGHIDVTAPRRGAAARYEQVFAFDQRAYAEQGFGATANLAVRRAVFQAVGPFDQRLRSSGDREWGLRATASGIPVRYCPTMVVEHEARTSLAELIRKRRRLTGGKHALDQLGLDHALPRVHTRPRLGRRTIRPWLHSLPLVGEAQTVWRLSREGRTRGSADAVGLWGVLVLLDVIRRLEARRLRRGGEPRR